jgi:CheY-like chemotaxis protein
MATILVVDDEKDMREAIVLTLMDVGYTPIAADNGVTAIEIAKKEKPDLIISDVMMPNMNGYMLLEVLKEHSLTSAIPVILMTGAAFNAGAWQSDPNVEYIAKPFAHAQLLSAVERMLQTQSDSKK